MLYDFNILKQNKVLIRSICDLFCFYNEEIILHSSSLDWKDLLAFAGLVEGNVKS